MELFKLPRFNKFAKVHIVGGYDDVAVTILDYFKLDDSVFYLVEIPPKDVEKVYPYDAALLYFDEDELWQE